MKNILIVDDEAIIAMRLQEQLSAMGYHVVGMSHSAEECLENARKFHPDLILMDIKMPGSLDGIGIAERIKAELEIPVVFITAYTEDQIIERAKQVEPYGYIVKPFQARELKATVELALYKKEMELRLRDSELRYRSIIDSMADAIHVVDRELKILTANPALVEWVKSLGLGPELTGRTVMEVFPFLPDSVVEEYQQVFENGRNMITEEENRIDDRKYITETRKIPILEQESVQGIVTVIRDITQRKAAEKILQDAHDELERRVEERTVELEVKSLKLEELNTALKILLEKRDEDRKNFEERVASNITDLVLPYLSRLKSRETDETKTTYLEVIETNLNEIVLPFAHKLSSKYMNLSPAEIRVADLVRQGKKTKEIAEILNLSYKTIERQRENIRKKLGIKNKKVHLQSHLLSFI